MNVDLDSPFVVGIITLVGTLVIGIIFASVRKLLIVLDSKADKEALGKLELDMVTLRDTNNIANKAIIRIEKCLIHLIQRDGQSDVFLSSLIERK